MFCQFEWFDGEDTAVPLPRMARIKQPLFCSPLSDKEISESIKKGFRESGMSEAIKCGHRIAITAGSRGLDRFGLILRTIAEQVRISKGTPFVIPAMGSHGGGSAEGQIEVLRALGITEQSIGCKILSGLAVEIVGETDTGLPVYLDAFAAKADGVIVVNRIKQHTDFCGKIESGLMKMISIGAGNVKQARLLHSYGESGLRDLMPEFARVILNKSTIYGGVAILEDGYSQCSRIACAPADGIEALDSAFLQKAKEIMPRLPINALDVLIIDRIGKDISGTGMDLGVVGRQEIDDTEKKTVDTLNVKVIIIRDLSESCGGNATGVGYADIVVKRAIEKIDLQRVYLNALAGGHPRGGAIPIIAKSDSDAIHIALNVLLNPVAARNVRLIRIRDTSSLDEMDASKAVLHTLQSNPQIRVIAPHSDMSFDDEGNLKND